MNPTKCQNSTLIANVQGINLELNTSLQAFWKLRAGRRLVPETGCWISPAALPWVQPLYLDIEMDVHIQLVMFFSRPRSQVWPHHGLSLSFVILIDSSTGIPVHVLILSSRPHGLPHLHAPGIVPCIISSGISFVSSWCDHSISILWSQQSWIKQGTARHC